MRDLRDPVDKRALFWSTDIRRLQPQRFICVMTAGHDTEELRRRAGGWRRSRADRVRLISAALRFRPRANVRAAVGFAAPSFDE